MSGNTKIDSNIPLSLLFSNQIDFDVDKTTFRKSTEYVGNPNYEDYDIAAVYDDDEIPDEIAEYDPAKHTINYKGYPRILEQLPPDLIKSYVLSVGYNIYFKTNSDGYIKYKFTHQVQGELNYEEGSEDTQLSDLLVVDDDRERENKIAEAQRRLPYTLKRLLVASNIVGVHLPAYLCVYAIAKRANDHNRALGSQKKLTAREVFCYGPIYKYRQQEIYPTPIADPGNIHAFQAFALVTNRLSSKTGYTDDAIDLLKYIDILNIKTNVADFLAITNKYFSEHKFRIITLTTNDHYLPDVANALFDKEVDDEETNNLLRDGYEDIIYNYDVRLASPETRLPFRYNEHAAITAEKNILDTVQMILEAMFYFKLAPRYIDVNSLYFQDGILFSQGSPVHVPLRIFSDWLSYPDLTRFAYICNNGIALQDTYDGYKVAKLDDLLSYAKVTVFNDDLRAQMRIPVEWYQV